MSAYASPYKRARTSGESSTSGWLAHLLGGLGVAGATYMGNPALAVPAYNLGYSIGSRIKDITGFGAYTLRKNTIAGVVPSMGNSPRVEGGLTVSHREFLGNVVTSASAGEFSIYSLTINPGNPQTWEWLAQMACNYEQWIPEGIGFIFKSTSSDALNSTNTALGSVIMATQYDLLSKPFTNKADMLSYEYTSSGLPSDTFIHFVECDPLQIPISVLDVTSPSASAGDPRFKNLGIFSIATDGFQGTNVVIGELWVTYQVTLLKPKLYSSLGKYNDYLRITTYPSDERNVDFDDWPLGNLTTMNVEMANCTVYPLVNGQFISGDGHQFGNIERPGFYIHQDQTSKIRIYWPCYAFQASYMVVHNMESSASYTMGAYGLTNGSSYGALSVPNTLFSFPSATVGSFHTFVFGTSVPGQKLLPYDPSLSRPYTEFSIAPFSGANVDSYQFTIVQINSDQPLSSIN